jgi:heme A synthase
MQEIVKFVIGIAVLILGFPVGNYLAKITKEEIKAGQIWFRLIVIISLVGAVLGLVAGNDAALFGFSFIAIVTSRSLENKGKKGRRKRK